MRTFLISIALAGAPLAQVHYHDHGAPWNRKVDRGPDAEVDGWYLNLGITGMRVELRAERPKALLVRHVFEGSPADGRVKVGDWILGAGGDAFVEEHQNGYGMEVFGARGPIGEFALALEAAQTKGEKGTLDLELEREGKPRTASLKLGTKYGAFGPEFPLDCPKSERLLDELCELLVEAQRPDGSFGSVVENTFAPLALLGTNPKKYAKSIRRAAKFHADTTHAIDEGSLINWRYMSAAIVLSEVALAKPDKALVRELEEIYAFLASTQYLSLDQVNPRVKESHPNDWPEDPMDSHGGWGHNPGFEGYGPIAMITGQGALAFSLMARAGVAVDRKRHDAAFAFLERGSGANGYVWYGDENAGDTNWADMGRTGAAGMANWLAPYDEKPYAERADLHAKVIGRHPESFPDTHGSPLMGMGYAALAAFTHRGAWRSVMDANRWWFALSQCHDGTYYYQPNRDNAGYDSNSRVRASAVTAFILSLPKRGLVLSGRED